MRRLAIKQRGDSRWWLDGRRYCLCTACKAGLPVRIKDINPQGIIMRWSSVGISLRAKFAAVISSQRTWQTAGINLRNDGLLRLAHRDLIIEAVFENLELKQQRWRKWSKIALLIPSLLRTRHFTDWRYRRSRRATWASYWPAFFSPVEKMPLVEIIPHASTWRKPSPPR